MSDAARSWAPGRERQIVTVARNVATRYLAIVVETVVGLVMLPFNVAHLGTAQYGLWMLRGSVTAYFSVLDLGYAGALVKFVAQYRAQRDTQALNEIASTLFFIFLGAGIAAYAIAAGVALNLEHLFKLTAGTGGDRAVAAADHRAARLPQLPVQRVWRRDQRVPALRPEQRGRVGSSVAVALVNVAVLLAGYGLIQLVAATTFVRICVYFVYRANAYRIFPASASRCRGSAGGGSARSRASASTPRSSTGRTS